MDFKVGGVVRIFYNSALKVLSKIKGAEMAFSQVLGTFAQHYLESKASHSRQQEIQTWQYAEFEQSNTIHSTVLSVFRLVLD